MPISDVHYVIVCEEAVAPAQGVSLTNFWDPTVHHFDSRKRPAEDVTEIIVHESGLGSVERTVASLRHDGYGVHLIIAQDGTITQHADLAFGRPMHAGAHNQHSIAIELATPYYPKVEHRGDPWTAVIKAPWAHRGYYSIPTLAQLEATAALIRWLSSEEFPCIQIPRNWHGLKDGKFYLGRIKGGGKPSPGIYAHHYFRHADGAFPVLYAWLRIEVGLSPKDAYAEAKRRAALAKSPIDVSDLIEDDAAPTKPTALRYFGKFLGWVKAIFQSKGRPSEEAKAGDTKTAEKE